MVYCVRENPESLPALEFNIRSIIISTPFDPRIGQHPEVCSKIDTLKHYVLENWNSVHAFQTHLAGILNTDIDLILDMWPQIADGMIASESDYHDQEQNIARN